MCSFIISMREVSSFFMGIWCKTNYFDYKKVDGAIELGIFIFLIWAMFL